jgi:hypothetical protein
MLWLGLVRIIRPAQVVLEEEHQPSEGHDPSKHGIKCACQICRIDTTTTCTPYTSAIAGGGGGGAGERPVRQTHMHTDTHTDRQAGR